MNQKIPTEELAAIAISALILLTLGFTGGWAARTVSSHDKVLLKQFEAHQISVDYYQTEIDKLRASK